MLSRNPTFRAYFQSQISSRFCSKIPNLEFQSSNSDPKLNTNLEFKSLDPEGYILHPTYRAYFQSRIPIVPKKTRIPSFNWPIRDRLSLILSLSASPLWVHDNHFSYQTSSMQLLSHDYPEVKWMRCNNGLSADERWALKPKFFRTIFLNTFANSVYSSFLTDRGWTETFLLQHFVVIIELCVSKLNWKFARWICLYLKRDMRPEIWW